MVNDKKYVWISDTFNCFHWYTMAWYVYDPTTFHPSGVDYFSHVLLKISFTFYPLPLHIVWGLVAPLASLQLTTIQVGNTLYFLKDLESTIAAALRKLKKLQYRYDPG
jgi:hypothetical protein